MGILGIIIVYISLATISAKLVSGQLENRLYLPPPGGSKPPSSTFNFLNLPPSLSSSNQFSSPILSPPSRISSPKFSPSRFSSPYYHTTCAPPPVSQIVKHSAWHPIKRTDTLYPILASSKRDEGEYFAAKDSKSCPAWRRRTSENDCVTFQWNSATNKVSFTAFDGCQLNQIPVQCEQLHIERFLVRCTFPNNMTITQHISKSDGQIWQLGYECWTRPDGRELPPTWSLYSVYPTVPDSLKRQIQSYVAALGFDPNDIRQPSYDNCPNLPGVDPQLIKYPETRPEYLTDPPQICSPPTKLLPRGSWHPEKKDDFLYYPLVYSNYQKSEQISEVQSLCGTQYSNIKRKKQCIASQFNSATSHLKFHYYDGCKQNMLNEKCLRLEEDTIAFSCELPGGAGEIRQYGVLGDNHTYILFYECWPQRGRKPVTWSLRSTSKIIPESLKQYVLDYAAPQATCHDHRTYKITHRSVRC